MRFIALLIYDRCDQKTSFQTPLRCLLLNQGIKQCLPLVWSIPVNRQRWTVPLRLRWGHIEPKCVRLMIFIHNHLSHRAFCNDGYAMSKMRRERQASSSIRRCAWLQIDQARSSRQKSIFDWVNPFAASAFLDSEYFSLALFCVRQRSHSGSSQMT